MPRNVHGKSQIKYQENLERQIAHAREIISTTKSRNVKLVLENKKLTEELEKEKLEKNKKIEEETPKENEDLKAAVEKYKRDSVLTHAILKSLFPSYIHLYKKLKCLDGKKLVKLLWDEVEKRETFKGGIHEMHQALVKAQLENERLRAKETTGDEKLVSELKNKLKRKEEDEMELYRKFHNMKAELEDFKKAEKSVFQIRKELNFKNASRINQINQLKANLEKKRAIIYTLRMKLDKYEANSKVCLICEEDECKTKTNCCGKLVCLECFGKMKREKCPFCFQKFGISF